MQAKSLLKKVFIIIAASVVLFTVQMMSDSLVVDVLCKTTNALLTIWTVWLLIKLSYLAILGIWRNSLARVKGIFRRKSESKPIEVSTKTVELKVQKSLTRHCTNMTLRTTTNTVDNSQNHTPHRVWFFI